MDNTKNNTMLFSPYFFLVIGLTLLVYTLLREAWLMAAAVVIIPFLALYIFTVLNKPYLGFITLFTMNYFFIGVLRYINIQRLYLEPHNNQK